MATKNSRPRITQRYVEPDETPETDETELQEGEETSEERVAIEVELGEMSPTIHGDNDPHPSVPENIIASTTVTRESSGVEYLGTFSPVGARSKATLPVVIINSETEQLVGVAVVSDPSYIKAVVEVVNVKYPGKMFEQASLNTLNRNQREIISRLIAKQRDLLLDRSSAVAFFGINVGSL